MSVTLPAFSNTAYVGAENWIPMSSSKMVTSALLTPKIERPVGPDTSADRARLKVWLPVMLVLSMIATGTVIVVTPGRNTRFVPTAA